ncbi:MAG: dynamin family protein [Treponema sp.]|jgi:alpha-tubulin suppressor-like RCC1 family protein/GTPase Era involved in 16S rRNA processing|nr:dynamin family protein [Treponema sp.]
MKDTIDHLKKLQKEILRYQKILTGNKNIKVGVFGCQNRGKSTLINALLGIEILPAQKSLGTTKYGTEIRFKKTKRKKPYRVTIIYNDREEDKYFEDHKEIDIRGQLESITNDNEYIKPSTKEIIIEGPFNLFFKNKKIIFIDTPGVEPGWNETHLTDVPEAEIYKLHTERTLEVLEHSDVDVVIFCLRCNYTEATDKDFYIEHIKKKYETINVVTHADKRDYSITEIINKKQEQYGLMPSNTVVVDSKGALKEIIKVRNEKPKLKDKLKIIKDNLKNKKNMIEFFKDVFKETKKVLSKKEAIKDIFENNENFSGFLKLEELILENAGIIDRKTIKEKIVKYESEYSKLNIKIIKYYEEYYKKQGITKKQKPKKRKNKKLIIWLIIIAIILFFALPHRIEYRPYSVEFSDKSSVPAEFIGRWYSGDSENTPFMYEITPDGQIIREDESRIRKFLKEGFTLIIYTGNVIINENKITIADKSKTIGTADLNISNNVLTLTNIEGKMQGMPVKHFKHDIKYDCNIDDKKYTTAINLEFKHLVRNLSIEDILINEITGSVEPGNLYSNGKYWTLPVTVTKAGTIEISIDVPGIDNTPQPINVDNRITWKYALDNNNNTTRINFSFIKPVNDLSIDNIEIISGTTSVEKVNITGNENYWSLNVKLPDFKSGDINVKINYPGVDADWERINVYWQPLTWTWSTESDDKEKTKAVKLKFSHPVDLLIDDIVIYSGTANAEKKDLIGSEDKKEWTLNIVYKSFNSGNVLLRINKQGIENTSKQIPVLRPIIKWSAVAVGSPYTTGIEFIFDESIDEFNEYLELIFNNIIIEGTSKIERGVFEGDKTTWLMPINVTSIGNGNISVFINVSGIEEKRELIDVTREPVKWSMQIDDDSARPNINFEFSESIDLLESNIIISDENGAVVRTIFNGEGTLWSLEVIVVKSGEIEISINQNGIDEIKEKREVKLSPVKYAHAGEEHSIIIREDGSLWTWGLNNQGQLGDNTIINKNSPELIDNNIWVDISVVGQNTAAVSQNGKLWLWGGDRNYFTAAQMEENFSSVSLGSNFVIAIKNGELWAWGNNANGRLGDGSTINHSEPVRIGQDSTWSLISTGEEHTAAIKKDGSLWTWGHNGQGRLGRSGNERVPLQESERAMDWSYVSAGSMHTMAIKNDGSLWAWGNNSYGRLGLGDTRQRDVPVRIGDENWLSVSAGQNYTVAVKADGSLWGWGNNDNNKLGVSGHRYITSPERIGSGSNWKSVSAGINHILLIDNNGSLWSMGENNYGQLGNGTTTPSGVPIPVTY